MYIEIEKKYQLITISIQLESKSEKDYVSVFRDWEKYQLMTISIQLESKSGK